MKKLTVIIVLITLGLLFILALPISASEREVKKEFEIKAGGTVTIDLKTGGGIKITGWNKDYANVLFEIKEREPNQVEVSIEKSGNDINISSEYADNERHNNTSANLTLSLPSKFNIDFNTMGGGVIINVIDGKIEGKTMGGGLSFTKLSGTIDVETMGGGIVLKDSDVDGEVKTMGGGIVLENVNGDVDATTMGGAVTQINVQGKNKDGGKEVNLTTMGGPIEIDNAPNGANVKTMGGGIDINKAGKFVRAETMGGSITIKALDGGVEATTMGGDIEVKMVGNPAEGDRSVTLESKGGDITLVVPAELSMSVDIEVTLKDNSWNTYNKDNTIESDFKLDIERKSKSGSKEYIIGTGSINGGNNKIKIKTINGNVYLRKS